MTRLSKRKSGFTLVELLVAMAVLSLLLVLVIQVMNSASTAMRGSGKHMDSDTEARLLLNRIGADIVRMVKRPDVDYSAFKQPSGTLGAQYGSAGIAANPQSGNDQMAFYCETDGYYSGATQPSGSQKAPVALIAYTIANDTYSNLPGLRRMGKGLGWEPDASGSWLGIAYLPITLSSRWPGLTGSDPDYKTVSSQVFRFEYTYLLKATAAKPPTLSLTPWDTTASPAHTSMNGFKDVAAIVVAIAVLDTTSRVIVNSYDSLTKAFPDALDPASDATYKGDIASAWNAVVNSANFAATAQIPIAAASSVRVYQRYFYLDAPR